MGVSGEGCADLNNWNKLWAHADSARRNLPEKGDVSFYPIFDSRFERDRPALSPAIAKLKLLRNRARIDLLSSISLVFMFL